MMLFAGIDGGQTSTEALIADEHGTILGRGLSGGCDHIGQSTDSRRFADAVESSLAAALAAASLDPNSTFEAVVAGVSGYEGAIHGVAPAIKSDRVVFVHDAPIAHAGAFALGVGVIVISGTGSVAYGVNLDGKSTTVGGWGFLFGDEGSAFDIARLAISAAMAADDEGLTNALGAAACARFGQASLRDLARAFYLGRVDRAELASFAIDVVRLAEDLHPDALDILEQTDRTLVRLAWTCAARLRLERHPFAVALSGGAFESQTIRLQAESSIVRALPLAKVIRPRYDAATGALFLAYREVGHPLPDRFGAVMV